VPGFNAGEIEATLTLKREPFQVGLDQAKAEADAFANNRYDVTLGAKGEEARAEIERTRLSAEEFARTDASLKLHVENAEANSAMSSSRKLAEDLGRQHPNIPVTANAAQATTEMGQALAAAKRLEAEKALIKVGLDKILLENDILVLRAKIVEMDRLAVTVKAKADVIQAAAELAGLEAQAAALDRREIQLRVKAEGLEEVRTAAAQASEGMSKLQMYAGLAAAALPLVGAAVVALPGLIAAAAVPMAAVALGADGITAAFQRISPELIGIQGVVQDTFQQGMAPAVANISVLLGGLGDQLGETASMLSTMAESVTRVVATSSGFSDVIYGVNALIDQLTPGIAGLTGNLIGLAQQGIAGLQPLGAVFTQLSTEWQAVVDTLQRTGQGQAAVAALVQVLGGLLQLLPPLVQLGASLMAAIGAPLAAALQLVADVLTPIAALFSALPGPIQTVVAAVTAFRIAMSLIGSSGSQAAAATQAVGTAAETAARGVATAEQSTSRLGQAFNTVMTPVRAVGSVFSEMGASYSRVASGIERDTGGVTGAFQRFATVGAGSIAAGATGIKSALGGVVSLLGGPWGIAIGAATIGLGLLGDHMAANAQKAQDLAQASQGFADSLSRTGGVVTSATTQLVAHAAVQDGLVQSTDQLGISSQNVTTAITQQGPALDGLRAQLQGVIDSGTTYGTTMDGDVTITTSDAAKAAQDALGKLNDLAGAFNSGQVAAKALGDAMGQAGAHFGDIAAGSDAANRQTALLAQAMQTLGDNTASASDKVKAFAGVFESAADSPRTFLEAQLKANESVTKFGESLGKIPAAVVSAAGAIDTTSKAGQTLATNVLGAAKAYDDLYGATLQNAQAQGVAMPQAIAQASAAASAYRQRLIEQAQAHGLTRQAAEAMANTYLTIPKDITTQIQQPGMVEAVANAIGLKGHIEAIPGGKSIIVDAPQTPAVIAQLEALGLKVTTLPNGKVSISADTGPAAANIDGLVHQIGAIPPVNIPVNATTAQAQAALDQLMGAVNAASGTVNIDGNNVPAGTALQQIIAAINAGKGTVTVNGQTVPAAQALGQIIAAINAGKGTVTVNGQTVPAAQALSQLIGRVNSSSGTVQVGANTAGANAAVRSLVNTWNGYTIRINAVVSSHVGGLAAGGIVRPMASGGIIPFADGGAATPAIDADWMRGGVATVVQPGMLRLIGDNPRVPESYIPMDSSDRSRAILAQTASEMGWSLAPKITGAALSGVASTLSPASGARRGPALVRGSDGAFSGDIVAAIRALQSSVEQLQKARGDVTINAPTYNPTAEPSSESQARALRTGAALVSLLPR
jgi:hypothetical protein